MAKSIIMAVNTSWPMCVVMTLPLQTTTADAMFNLKGVPVQRMNGWVLSLFFLSASSEF